MIKNNDSINYYHIITAIVFFVGVIIISTSGYMIIEEYSLSEGIYMSIITIATVGYREIKPLSEAGRWFTILIILLGFSSLAFAGNIMVETLLKKNWDSGFEAKKMKRIISRLKGHYIICGAGKVGSAAADHLMENGTDFVIIEEDEEICNEIRKKNYICMKGDATREAALRDAGIKRAKGLLALLNSDPENLFTVLTARELNPTLHIIARSEVVSSEKKILRAGADSVSSPYATAGKQIATNMLAATGKLSMGKSIPNTIPKWITVQKGSDIYGETISSASLKIKKTIIGLRRKNSDFIFPDATMKLKEKDKVLISNKLRTLDDFAPKASKKRTIIIIDDNAVIRRLYTRLFQKAGFIPLTADNGHDGLNMIINEKPAAAVIDHILPGLYGIELCKKIRKNNNFDGVKLILFTGDDEPSLKKSALAAGADAVVTKSPEAFEIVETTLKLLQN